MIGVATHRIIDHIGLTVPELDTASKFYYEVLGGHELYRIGPFDAAEMPRTADGRDWTEAHINVALSRMSRFGSAFAAPELRIA
jgi:glyoxylase I family protein